MKSDYEGKKKEAKDLQKQLSETQNAFNEHQTDCAQQIKAQQENMLALSKQLDEAKEIKRVSPGESGLQSTIAELRAALESKDIQAGQQIQSSVDKLAVSLADLLLCILLSLDHANLTSIG